MTDNVPERDDWQHSPPKLPRVDAITLDEINEVLRYDEVKNSRARSVVSQRVMAANEAGVNGGMTEVGVDVAVALQALNSPDIQDILFQPFAVKYYDGYGKLREHMHDLLIVSKCGHKRLIFVLDEVGHKEPKTLREIDAIAAATPTSLADGMAIVNASCFSRQRRENLLCMHWFVCDPDPDADKVVLEVAKKLKNMWMVKDLFTHIGLSRSRVLGACHRLVACGLMQTNLDQAFNENSRVVVSV